jgi:hypothetical protein
MRKVLLLVVVTLLGLSLSAPAMAETPVESAAAAVTETAESVKETASSVKDEVFDRLDAIAEKMGIAVEYLWKVLVRQALAEGVGRLLIMGMFCGAVGLLIWICWKKVNWEESIPDKDTREFCIIAAVTVLGVASIILLIATPIVSVDGVKFLINPEYYAFQEVRGLLSK